MRSWVDVASRPYGEFPVFAEKIADVMGPVTEPVGQVNVNVPPVMCELSDQGPSVPSVIIVPEIES
jgi:hypothetical protein